MRDLLGFLAFSHGWTWLFWMVAGISSESVWEPPVVIFFCIGGAGVLMGGVVMSWSVYGRSGIKELGPRIVDPRPIAGRWRLVIWFLFLALALAAALIAELTGVSAEPIDLRGALDRLAHPAQLLVFAAFILIIGPLPEEIGWRGYLLDRLQLRWNALSASLVIAAIR